MPRYNNIRFKCCTDAILKKLQIDNIRNDRDGYPKMPSNFVCNKLGRSSDGIGATQQRSSEPTEPPEETICIASPIIYYCSNACKFTNHNCRTYYQRKVQP